LVHDIVEGLYGPNNKINFEKFKEAFLDVITIDPKLNNKIESSLSATMAVFFLFLKLKFKFKFIFISNFNRLVQI
jgi:hypothetical protein